VAKTMTWELNSAKGVLAHDASIGEVSLPQVMWETQDNHQVNENIKKSWIKSSEMVTLT
jgi:hypothetical protein